MHPILFHLGSLTVYTYGVLVATGVVVGLFLARWQGRKQGLDPDRVWNVGIYMVLVALLGSKLWLVLGDAGYYWRNPRDIFSFATLQSGGDFYGGILFALVLLFLYVWRQKLGFLAVADAFVAPLALGHAIGRLGCFTAGCCWGKPTTMPWGVVFRNPLAAQLVGTPLGVKLHPTEIYEAIAEFANFLFLVWLGRRYKFAGELFAAWLILYGIERGAIEFFRGDPGRGLMFGGAISFMQIVSLAMIAFGAWLFLRDKTQKLPAAVPAAARR